MATTITPLTHDLIPAYIAIRRRMLTESPRAYGSSVGDDPRASPEELARSLEGTGFAVMLGMEGGAVVAAGGMVRDRALKMRHRAMIWGVFCAAEHRGKGYGRGVVTGLIECARSWEGVGVVNLSASERSTGAIALYESLGFVRWGVEPDVVRVDGVGCAEVHMRLVL